MRLGREIIDLGNLENDSNAIYFEGRDDSSIYPAYGGEQVGHTEAFRRASAGVFTAQPVARISQLS